MTRSRKEQISVEDTPYYHLFSRCVRRTMLCGKDEESGNSYEHRRQWIEDRIRLLASLFTVDICAYAVMSNHYHICVKLCPEEIEALSDNEILDRWTSLYNGPLLVQKKQAGKSLGVAESKMLDKLTTKYRKRLSDVSWFMKCLNESIAKRANREDKCTGHFWEARFKSQGLPTEEALLSCMAYVDLNPVRAKMAATPESSDHTSIKERITPCFDLSNAILGQKDHEQQTMPVLNHFNVELKPLAKFSGSSGSSAKGNSIDGKNTGLLCSFSDYLELVDYTGRIIREDKRGAIPHDTPPILQRLSIEPETWLANSTGFEKNYHKHFAYRKKELADTS